VYSITGEQQKFTDDATVDVTYLCVVAKFSRVNTCACKNGFCEPHHALFGGDLSSLWQDLI